MKTERSIPREHITKALEALNARYTYMISITKDPDMKRKLQRSQHATLATLEAIKKADTIRLT